MSPACPACFSNETIRHNSPVAYCLCRSCGHRWLESVDRPLQQRQDYYAQLSGRNVLADSTHEKKMVDRLNTLAPLLHDGMRILEIGCAEGELGRRVKAIVNVEYDGIELSKDALTAMQWLDHVSRHAAAVLKTEPYDLILSFHVLEHIPDIRAELGHWSRLLKPSGKLVIEVPNEAGHPLLSWDANAEHLHQFTATSLSALLHHAGFAVSALSTGHFESVVYPDSLRIQAYARMAGQTRQHQLVARFKSVLPSAFIVYGIGGDFNNYVAPILAELPVAALVDADVARHGTIIAGHQIVAFDVDKFSGLPVLVTSLRYQAEIAAALQQQGVPPYAIYGLDAIFG